MEYIKSLSKYVLIVVSVLVFAACGQSQQTASSSSNSNSAQGEPEQPVSDPARVVPCYDANGKALPAAAALIVDSVKIVYEHRPCEIVLTVHNVSANVIGNLKGTISLYGSDGQKYDSVEFSKSIKMSADEVASVNIYLGDSRVHPNQEWNRNILLHFAKTNPGRFSFIGSDNDWCECIAKVVEIRFDSFEVFE